MKGMEFGHILGVIFLIILIVLLVSIFISYVFASRQGVMETKDFRWYCIFWSRNGYRGTSTYIEGEGDVYMDPYCTKALGISCIIPTNPTGGCMPANETLWERCRDACRLEKTG